MLHNITVLLYFYQINGALVSISEIFQKDLKILTPRL